MQISHSTLTHAVELAAKATTKTRIIHIWLHELGLHIRGVDRTHFPKLISFEQIVSWNNLASPVARNILDATFAKIVEAATNESAKAAGTQGKAEGVSEPAQ